jgi:hypothetical protein
MGYIASPMLDMNYMLGNLVGRTIVISLFAYILWYIYNKMTPVVPYFPEERRFGRTSGYSRQASRFGRRR